MNSIKIVENDAYDDVLIVFSARKMAAGKFTFYKQVIEFPANIIFVNDYSTSWYLNGTPEFKDELEFINFLLGKIYQLKRKYGKVYTLGSSMGAYAALKYGSILQANKILAMGPESELCIPLGRSVESIGGKYSEGAGDISNLNYKEPENVCIISGNNDIVDFYCASKFRAGNKKIQIQIINNHTHVVAQYIHDRIPLKDFIKKFFLESAASTFETFEIGHTVKPEIAKSIKMFNQQCEQKKIDLSLKADILKVADSCPKWSMIQYFSALILAKENKNKDAIDYLLRALELQHNLGRARFKLIQLYIKNSQFDDALREAEIAKELQFTFSIGMLMLKIYEHYNDFVSYNGLLAELKELKLTKQQQETLVALVAQKNI